MTDNDRYEPYRDLRFYPGTNLADDRRRAVEDLGVDASELTTDDIAWNLGVMWTKTMYSVWQVAKDRYGDEAAQEMAEELGYRMAKANLSKWMAAHAIEELTPEDFARFQDNRHALGGAKHAESFISYDADGVSLYRTGCGFHDNRPEGCESFCQYSAPGFFRGYAEVDPRIDAEVLRCRSRGDSQDFCELRFRIAPRDGASRSAGT